MNDEFLLRWFYLLLESLNEESLPFYSIYLGKIWLISLLEVLIFAYSKACLKVRFYSIRIIFYDLSCFIVCLSVVLVLARDALGF